MNKKIHVFPERESKTLEFKSKLPSYKILIKTCITFANGTGGKIVIGVDDKTREVIGISPKDREKCFEDFPQSLFESVTPYLVPEIYEQNLNEQSVIIIQIWPGAKKPYFLKSEGLPQGVYLRVGSSTKRASQEYIEDLLRENKRISYDEEVTDYPKDILSDELLSQVYGRQKMERLLSTDKVIGSLPANPKEIHPTVGGILFFSENPEQYLPEAEIICSQFRGTSGRDIIQSIELYGPISVLAESCLKLLKQWLERDLTLKGYKLSGQIIIPEAALREAINNALIHRKYFIPGPIKAALYENRLEIFNPGNFPGLISVENLGDGTTFLRNPVLAKLARKVHMIEKLGSGIRLIFESCQKAKLKKPIYCEDGDFVKITFLFEREIDEVLPEKAIIKLARQKGKLKIKDVMELLEVSRNTATRKLNALIQKGRLKRYGKGPNVYYSI